MKIFKYLIPSLMLAVACQSEPTKTAAVAETAESLDQSKTLVLPWSVQFNENTHAMEIKREPAADMTNLQPADIVDAINIKYPETKLTLVKLEGTTAYVSITDATYLTQRSGSDGARAYLAEATFSLTEMKGIESVDFTFKEGDHARPGVYTRSKFQF